MIDRRKFLWSATGVGLTGLLGRSVRAAATHPTGSLERIGVQLYTVRSLMESDFEGTLRQVAAIGYDEVEFAGYFGRGPAEVKALLAEVGLRAPACHVSLDTLRGDLAATLDAARTVGHDYVVCPWLAPEERGSAAGYRALAGLFNEVGAACREAGLRFAYHNHEFEFENVDGQVPMDLLIEGTDSSLVHFEIDLFWITKGGRDPLAYFARYPGRFPLCHVKDMADGGTMVDVGAGRIDFSAIFARSEEAGLRHYFVEHDQPADPIASIAASHAYLEGLTF